MHTVKTTMPLLKSLILSSVLLTPIGIMQATNIEIAQASPNCTSGSHHGGCRPPTREPGQRPPDKFGKGTKGDKKAKGKTCTPGNTRGCRNYESDFKPKRRPKK